MSFSDFVVEVVLLQMLLGFISRGGMSLSAFHEVYSSAYAHMPAGSTQFMGESGRSHFASMMILTLIIWSSMRMIWIGCPDRLNSFRWLLRPHHLAEDFKPSLALCPDGYRNIACQHACRSWEELRAMIVEAKWGFQTALCGERGSQYFFDGSLGVGFHVRRT